MKQSYGYDYIIANSFVKYLIIFFNYFNNIINLITKWRILWYFLF